MPLVITTMCSISLLMTIVAATVTQNTKALQPFLHTLWHYLFHVRTTYIITPQSSVPCKLINR